FLHALGQFCPSFNSQALRPPCIYSCLCSCPSLKACTPSDGSANAALLFLATASSCWPLTVMRDYPSLGFFLIGESVSIGTGLRR
ncbi:MAG: hypothetical protein N6V49_11545, partial [Serratia symbiotica]|nr:hypothetical protein [Serratia symbiotica]